MNRKVSVAPMMDCTDRHERYFLRLISKNTLLYSEMVVSEAIHRGDKKKLLEFNINEKPIALKIGGLVGQNFPRRNVLSQVPELQPLCGYAVTSLPTYQSHVAVG